MAVRLVITLNASPGRGGELAQTMRGRCAEVLKEPGCEQFEAFRSVDDPDKIVLLERWKDQDALGVHARLQATRPPASGGLMAGQGEREDYTYNRTR